jgi:regulatory protein
VGASRHTTRGLSRSALRRELRGKGVDDETVATAVDTIGVDDEEAAARALVAGGSRAPAG